MTGSIGFLLDMAEEEQRRKRMASPVSLLDNDDKKKRKHPAKKYEPHVDEKTTPKHYTELAITPVDVIECWELGFHTGNAVKYIARAGRKEGESEIEDLKKALWYLQRRIKQLEEKENR